MSYRQLRHSISIWGTLRVGAENAYGTMTFGSGETTVLSQIGTDHLHTPDALTVQGTAGFEGILSANPIQTEGGSALTANGQIGFDGSTFYAKFAGTILYWTPDGTISV